jgi:hypothetical protein
MNVQNYARCERFGKVRYHNAGGAWKAVAQMTNSGKHRTRKGELHAWRCEACQGWHLGHKQDAVA